jgi:Arc/MetJ family transcription regulator
VTTNATPPEPAGVYISDIAYILIRVGKHLVDIDERALGEARAELGTRTIKDTVNVALRRAAGDRGARVAKALDTLSRAQLVDREDAWR